MDFRAAERHGMTVLRELFVLHTVGSGGSNEVRTLSAALAVPKAAITRAFDALVGKGYAVRAPCHQDRRLVMLELTIAGKKAAKEIFK